LGATKTVTPAGFLELDMAHELGILIIGLCCVAIPLSLFSLWCEVGNYMPGTLHEVSKDNPPL
jgi:hypothetical protein